MLIYGLLIYVSFLFLKTRKEEKLLNVMFSKSLFSFSVYYLMTSLYLSYVMIKSLVNLIKVTLSSSSDVTTAIKNNFGSSAEVINALKVVRKPLIFMDYSSFFIILYAIAIFIICLITFLKVKENKNIKTFITFVCFLAGYILFMFCPFSITCALIIFIPQFLGLFLTIAVLKQLTPSKRDEINIKGGKVHFVFSIITLVLVSLNLFLNILWAVFGPHIVKSLSGLNISYV